MMWTFATYPALFELLSTIRPEHVSPYPEHVSQYPPSSTNPPPSPPAANCFSYPLQLDNEELYSQPSTNREHCSTTFY